MTERAITVFGERLQLKPWRFGCWSPDGRPVECDRHGAGDSCCYHEEWMRIAGEDRMIAWIASLPRSGGELAVFVWDHGARTYIEILTSRGTRFKCGSFAKSIDNRSLEHAKAAADKAIDRLYLTRKGQEDG